MERLETININILPVVDSFLNFSLEKRSSTLTRLTRQLGQKEKFIPAILTQLQSQQFYRSSWNAVWFKILISKPFHRTAFEKLWPIALTLKERTSSFSARRYSSWFLLHAISLQLLRLILAEGGSCSCSSWSGCGGERLLDGVPVPCSGHVARRRWRGSVRILLISSGGGGSSRVLGISSSGVVEVRGCCCSSSSCCCSSRGLHMRDHHAGLNKGLRIDIVGRDPAGQKRHRFRAQPQPVIFPRLKLKLRKSRCQICQSSPQSTANPFIKNWKTLPRNEKLKSSKTTKETSAAFLFFFLFLEKHLNVKHKKEDAAKLCTTENHIWQNANLSQNTTSV